MPRSQISDSVLTQMSRKSRVGTSGASPILSNARTGSSLMEMHISTISYSLRARGAWKKAKVFGGDIISNGSF